MACQVDGPSWTVPQVRVRFLDANLGLSF